MEQIFKVLKPIPILNRTILITANSKSARNYSRNVKHILRNRYPHRNMDGTYKEYNETITIVPKEFEKQGILSIYNIPNQNFKCENENFRIFFFFI